MSTKKHIVDYLSETRNRGGSDLHITGDAPPACRINGTLEALADHDISPDEAKELVLGVLSESQRARLEEDLELDFSISRPLVDFPSRIVGSKVVLRSTELLY